MNDKTLYFGLVEFEESQQIFQQMNLNTAPVIYHFPAKGREKKQDQMEFQRFGIDSDAMAKFVAERTGVHVSFLFFLIMSFFNRFMYFVHQTMLHQLLSCCWLCLLWDYFICAGTTWNFCTIEHSGDLFVWQLFYASCLDKCGIIFVDHHSL